MSLTLQLLAPRHPLDVHASRLWFGLGYPSPTAALADQGQAIGREASLPSLIIERQLGLPVSIV